ncbi:MAG TPA: response regulator [Vicinamibacterales bacterium]
MTPRPDSTTRPTGLLPPSTLAGFVVALIALAAIALVTYRAATVQMTAGRSVTRSMTMLQRLDDFLSTMKDAETGQRGYLLTGEERYLGPYTAAKAAIGPQLEALNNGAQDAEVERQRLGRVRELADEKMTELAETIALRQAGRNDEARALVMTDSGRNTMDGLRQALGEVATDERQRVADRQADWDSARDTTVRVAWGGSALLLVLIVAAAMTTSRDYQRRQADAWVGAGQAALGVKLQGEQTLTTLGERVLSFLTAWTNAQVGSVYVVDTPGRLQRVGGYALPASMAADTLRDGEGLVGQAARENRLLHVTDVPEGYLPIESSVGRGASRELVIAPATADGVVQAVVELGFLRPVPAAERELLERASQSLGIAVRSARDRTRLEELLQETQRQAEELQAQQEELRVNNEELEEQALALKESQARLETQQAELEQINTHLEEQSEALERQKDELTASQTILADKAGELERSNRYKSEFLANMSHELRTPLNSSLILAKVLADNKTGNLTDEQVRFAQTISSAGNDLLALINDILDLSKIEAGKVDVSPAPVSIAAATDALVKGLQPIAQEKRLGFSTVIEPGTPDRIETDSQRLGQILRNLLSNALKFTERGEVRLQVGPSGSTGVSFTVRDTGIGIAPDQQDFIFEAFRQADGSTHRKYGGTGLGLSISRDLARLLGGDITLESTAGVGSAFTLTLPMAYAPRPLAPPTKPLPHVAAAPAFSERVSAPPRPVAAAIEDDRDRLEPGARRILVVEDDTRFAAILRDLSHEMGFQCVVTHSANDGLAAAGSYRPDAIVLDINLPDHSGLGVLDQLKRNPATRHIPVHVASVADFSKEALERGAIGYALKPVKRDDLVEAFRRLENKASQSVRRVLVVEDDARQRESIRQLLSNGNVQITTVETAAAALDELRTTTFDCMVMDLNLPDVSGYDLLERMAAQEDVSFPPVIVYTGHSLSRDEEQRLRRFSKSIIIKDARSPERLLDEVTLFLHQVEASLPVERQRMLQAARDRDATLDGRRILVVEDDARNIFALSSVLEPKGARLVIARNGREALEALDRSQSADGQAIDLVLMDIMMPEMDGLTAMREIRRRPEWKKLPIIALTAKAMRDDQERCLAAGANDYIAKPLDVERLLSLVRVWMPS